MPTPLELLDESQAILQEVVDGAAGLLDEPSPCENYTVRQVISHTLATIDSFTAPLDGGPGATFPEIIAAEDRTGGDASAATAAAVARSHAAWATVDDFGAEVKTNLGPIPGGTAISVVTFQNVVHAWDIAKATGQTITPSDDLMAVCEGTAAAVLPIAPPGFFAQSADADGAASRVDRLAALTGRTV